MEIPYPGHTRTPSKRTVLELIRFTPGGISRAELARQIDLTRSTVSTIVAELLGEGLVRESESGPATGGRRPILLEINPQRGFVIGVDMGATHLGLLAADFQANVVSDIETPIDIRQGPQACLQQVDAQLRQFLESSGISLEQVLAIGFGVPGPVLVESGTVGMPPIMPGWDGFPIRSHLEKLWGRPVSLNNDAELGAVGEWAFGAGRVKRHMTYIKVGTGVGAGLILNGEIYRGASGLAGEIGHLTIQENGPLCACGNRGCLEALAGGAAIARTAIEAVKAGRRTQLVSIQPVESISARDVGRAARMGDLVAQQIVTEAGHYLGIAIAGIINLSNPSVVVIGGGVSQMGDLLLEPIRHVVAERSLRPAAQAVRITAAVLGRRSSSMGAVVQAIETALCVLTEGASVEKGGHEEKPFEIKTQDPVQSVRSYAGLEAGQ